MSCKAGRAPLARPSKLKSVTYTGARKVKCDERHENGCGVCEKAGRTCAGYGVNLSWVNGRNENRHGLQRSRISPATFATPILSDKEIGNLLSDVDNISAPLGTVLAGPFSVFRGSHSILIHEDVDNELADIFTGRERSDDDEDDTIIMPAYVDYGTDLSTDPGFASPGLEISTASSPHFGLSIPLFLDSQTSMLLCHYVNHVADLLQPVLHPRNPWRTTYFPLALESSPDLFLCQDITQPPPCASKALFHGLLSAAAFHLRNASSDSAEFLRLGLYHRVQALRALNAASTNPGSPQSYTVTLTAMLSLVTIDTMTGEDCDFPIHLKGCQQLQKRPRDSELIEGYGNQIHSICRFLTLLARTASHKIEPRRWSTKDSTFAMPYFSPDERSIEYIYGVTPDLGNLLQRTCQMAEYLASYSRWSAKIPPDLSDACWALGRELSVWSIDTEPFHRMQLEDGIMFEIARCQARAFHSAVSVYYCRAVQYQRFSAATALFDVEAKVQSVWQNLNAAEDLKDAYMGGSKRSAPMSWPAFIAACEASDRSRWVKWWNRMAEYRVGNLARQWQIIREIWNILDSDESIDDWRDALRFTGKHVLPI